MKKITIFFDCTKYVWYWLQPLYWARHELNKLGYGLEFVQLPQLSIYTKNWERQFRAAKQFDIVFLAFHHKSQFCKLSSDERKSYLRKLKGKCNRIVWLDASDSSGTCMFDVLPFVDLYLKKQIYKDRELYMSDYLGQRLYVDYYSKKYGLMPCEDETNCNKITNIHDLSKLDISWNAAFWNFIKSGVSSYLHRSLGLNVNLHKYFLEPNVNRDYLIFFNGSIPQNDSAITFQRKNMVKLINELDRKDCLAPMELLSRNEYLDIMRNSFVAPSPFGWGEICNRDFEAFMYGNCLLKPSMEHLETYPDLYVKDQTYIELDWDFKNFNNIAEFVGTDEGKKFAVQIARNGQKAFMDCVDFKKRNYNLSRHIHQVLIHHGI